MWYSDSEEKSPEQKMSSWTLNQPNQIAEGLDWTPFGNAYFLTTECGGVPAPAGPPAFLVWTFCGAWAEIRVQRDEIAAEVGETVMACMASCRSDCSGI